MIHFLDVLSQVIIATAGLASAWFLSRVEDWRRWGFIFAMFSQPCWFYVSYRSEQWGIFALAFFYTYCWIQGLWGYWIKPWLNKRKSN